MEVLETKYGLEIILALVGFIIAMLGYERWRDVRRGKAVQDVAKQKLNEEQREAAKRRDKRVERVREDLLRKRSASLGVRLRSALRRAIWARRAAEESDDGTD